MLLISLVGCVVGTYAAAPTEVAVLIDFYVRVRPWGFWEPVKNKAKEKYPDIVENTHFKRDMFNVGIGIIWQCSLTLIPMYIVVKEGFPLLTSILVLTITSLILKKNWHDKMNREEKVHAEFLQRHNL